MGGKTSTTTSGVTIPPEVLARYNSVNAQAQQTASIPFQTYSSNPNAFVAPLTPTQTAGIQNTNAATGMAQPYFNAATGFALAGTQPINAAPLDISRYMNPYLGTVLGSTEALVNQQNQQAMAGQTGNAINQGYFGGDRSGIASAVLQGQQELAGGQLYSGIASDAFQQAIAAAQQQQGVNLAAAQANRAALTGGADTLAQLGTGAQGAALTGAQAQLGAGQVEQQTEQAGLTALYNQFLQQQSYPFQVTQYLANIAEGTGALSGSTTTTTQPQSIFSDERLKEDMQPIGKGFDGANIYRFRYRGDPTTRIGMSAQEVERRHPEAVHEQGGFKAVDYGRATDDAAGFARAANDDFPDEPRRARAAGGQMIMPMAAGTYPEGVSPYDIAALLQAQSEMYAPFAQSGLYGSQAAAGPYGGRSHVPEAQLPQLHLMTAQPIPQGPSAAHQAAEAAGDVTKLGDAAKTAKKGFDWFEDQPWAPGYDPLKGVSDADLAAAAAPPATPDAGTVDDTRASSGGFIRAARQDGGDINPYGGPGGLNIPSGYAGTPKQLQSPGAPGQGPSALHQVGHAAGDVNSLIKAGETVGKGIDWLSSLASGVPFAEGGFVRAAYADGGDPEDLYKPPVAGLDIPDESQQQPRQLAVASPPKQGGGDNTLGDIANIAKLAMMFIPARSGGRIGRQAGGDLLGAPDDLITARDPDTEAPAPKPPPPPPRPPPGDQFGESLFLQNPAAGFGYEAARGAMGPHPTLDAIDRQMQANVAAGMKEAPPLRAGFSGAQTGQAAGAGLGALAPRPNAPPRPAGQPPGGAGRLRRPSYPPATQGPPAASVAPAATITPATAEQPPTAAPGDFSVDTPLQGGFDPGRLRDTSGGGFLPAVGHVLGGVGQGAEALAGYDPKTGKFDPDQLMRLFSGIAAMGATPTVHPLFALSQGLGGYANAYYQQQQAKADIQRTQAETGQLQQSIYNEMQNAVPPALRQAGVIASPGAGRAGQRTIYDHTGAPWHYDEAAEALPGGAPGEPAGAPSAAAAAAPAAAAAGAPAAAAAAPPPVAATAHRDPISVDYRTGVYTVGPGSDADDYVQRNYGLQAAPAGMSPVAARQWGQQQIAGNTALQAQDRREQATIDTLPSLDETMNTQRQYMQIGDMLSRLPSTGLGAPGAGFQQRQDAANLYVTLRQELKGLGFNIPDSDSADQVVQSGQVLDKLRALAGPQIANSNNQHAHSIAELISSVLPGGQYQPESARRVLATMMLQNQQAADHRQYATTWVAKHGNAVGMNEAFQQEFGPRYQAEEAAIPAMMAKGPGGQSAVDLLRSNPQKYRQFFEQGGRLPNGQVVPGYGVGSSRLWIG